MCDPIDSCCAMLSTGTDRFVPSITGSDERIELIRNTSLGCSLIYSAHAVRTCSDVNGMLRRSAGFTGWECTSATGLLMLRIDITGMPPTAAVAAGDACGTDGLRWDVAVVAVAVGAGAAVAAGDGAEAEAGCEVVYTFFRPPPGVGVGVGALSS